MTLPNELIPEVQIRTAKVGLPSPDGKFSGRVVPYEEPTELFRGVWEVFTRGALRAAVKDAARVKVASVNHGGQIIGQAARLDDREDGLWGEFRIVDTEAGREALTLLREGVVDELSIEFQQIEKDRTMTDREDGSLLIRHNRARLLGVAPVGHGAYGRGATVASVRAEERDAARRTEMAYLLSLRA